MKEKNIGKEVWEAEKRYAEKQAKLLFAQVKKEREE